MRYLSETLEGFAHSKMVLLGGPRQVGKTTMALEWVQRGKRALALNYDIGEDREALLARDFLSRLQKDRIDRLLLDEIHKHPRWKSLLKGLADKKISGLEVVVTGSSKLDLYQRKGDSLFGRYESLRLHPFSWAEWTSEGKDQKLGVPDLKEIRLPRGEPEPGGKTETAFQRLEKFSGFPEPLFANDELLWNRWRTRRRELLIQQDLRDLSQIRNLALVESLYLLLPTKIGSPLSINKLRETLDVSHDTVSEWLNYLERLYISFRLSPYTRKIQRGLKKEQKLYLWDWSQVSEPGPRFENMVASHLLKAVHFWADVGFGDFELYYIRTKEKEEVDFLLCRDRQPWLLVEAKLSDASFSPNLIRFSETLNVPAVQVTREMGVFEAVGQLSRESADTFFRRLV